MDIWDGQVAYRLESSMNNPKVVYAVQALSNIRQLLSRSVRGWCLM